MKRLIAGVGIFACVATAAAIAFSSFSHAQPGKGCKLDIKVQWQLEAPCLRDSTIPDENGAEFYAWNTFIALNWPAAANRRGEPDTGIGRRFGGGYPAVWETMRSKSELYPGNGSATVGPHGAVIDPQTHQATNEPDYGYDEAPDYIYSSDKVGGDGRIEPCPGQPAVATPASISLDETTQIGNNQTFAGVLPADRSDTNSKPQSIRYAVKMNKSVYQQVMAGGYWYHGAGSPLATEISKYQAALNSVTKDNPVKPYVNLAPADDRQSIELKTSWRPLTDTEAASGRFYKTTVRYYEKGNNDAACYREAVWGLVGLHLISYTQSVPWVIWATFEQADNILTAEGKRTEDVNGRRINKRYKGFRDITEPKLVLDGGQVKKEGDFCNAPGDRLFFRENPSYAKLPHPGAICVNRRWNDIPIGVIAANKAAHDVIAKYLAAGGELPLMFYKLVNVQPVPKDIESVAPETAATYYLANATIETDLSLGMFTGFLSNGVPVNQAPSGPTQNSTLLPFQSLRFVASSMAGGCAGCHAVAGRGSRGTGSDFSFAIGDNAAAPEPTEPFLLTSPQFRNYFP